MGQKILHVKVGGVVRLRRSEAAKNGFGVVSDQVRVNMLQSGSSFGEQMLCIQVIQRELKLGCRYRFVFHHWGVLALKEYSFHSVGKGSGGGRCMARIKGSAAVGGYSEVSVVRMGQHVNVLVERLCHCLVP